MKFISVNRHKIGANAKHQDRPQEAPIRVIEGSRIVNGVEVRVEGPSRIVYSPEHPLKCGAKVWIETIAAVFVDRGDGTTDIFPANQCECPRAYHRRDCALSNET